MEQEQKVVKLGINGFGRIGRLVLRAAFDNPKVQVVGINDPFMDMDQMIYSLSFDSVHGKFNKKISKEGNILKIENILIRVFNEKDCEKIGWGSVGADYICESSGVFLTKEKVKKHLEGGGKKVIISAPAKDDSQMIIMGVNEQDYKGQEIVSNGSCTTNCLAPLVKILEDNYGVEEGLMTTIHAVTATQLTVDGVSRGDKDYRGGRAAIGNIIPSSTGAAKAIVKVIPSLKDKLTGMAFRVPVLDVSVIDLTVRLTKSTDLKQIKDKITEASQGTMKGIIGVEQQQLVSSDFIHDSRSCIFDFNASIQLNPNFFKLVAWYDNEWAYSNRIVDLAIHMFAIDHQ